MSLEGWAVFATFWAVFVVSPGPNAVNCIVNGMTYGYRRALWGVLAILTQAALFLFLSALGVTALIAASPTAFLAARLIGAAFLVLLGLRGWMVATRPVPTAAHGGAIYGKAFAIATINVKSVAGYLAAFSLFVQPNVPIWSQMAAIVPTALTLTAFSYAGYTALGTWLGRLAYGAVMNLWFRRIMALCFIGYGVALGLAGMPGTVAP